ncbi:hypothetical protein HanIR_Chr16g0809301 [Helianthus annuus]|nr:hypothetical protein HanIR_Chr16g0809301 [Helianthus annuus]
MVQHEDLAKIINAFNNFVIFIVTNLPGKRARIVIAHIVEY